mmetsp:Transcript_28768/g.67665  ORF Transcript_28768/g.67665 Transcript_28768/m.67665 type:complete len:459 (+) Transcript_28768:26-1402(+)
MAEIFLEASDLGVAPDAEGYQELIEDVGSSPPWSLATLQAYFDRRYPGWDDPPKLGLSSPVHRLKYLDQALRSSDEPGIDESLKELDEEVKNSLLRTILRQDNGGILSDEVGFLLLLVGELGANLFDQRAGRKADRKEAERLQAAAEADGRAAAAAAQDAAAQHAEEAAVEADRSNRRCEALEAELQLMKEQLQDSEELAQEIQELRQANRALSFDLSQVRDELREAKAANATLIIAHEESEGALEEMSRRLQRSESTVSGGDTFNTSSAPAGDPAKLPEATAPAAPIRSEDVHRELPTEEDHGQAFCKGAAAALAMRADSSPLRSALLAWRCARLEAKLKKVSSNQAHVKVSGKATKRSVIMACKAAADEEHSCAVEDCCCKKQDVLAPCCRKSRLEVLQKALVAAEQRLLEMEGSAAEELLRSRGTWSKSVGKMLGVSSLALACSLYYEPYLGGGW